MTTVLVFLAFGLVTWLSFTCLTRNAVVAGIWMSATLILAGLLAGVLVLV